MLMREHLISFHFPGLMNVSLNNKFESFGNRLRSKAASFALECMAHFPFFKDCVKICLSLSKFVQRQFFLGHEN